MTTHCLVIGRREIKEILYANPAFSVSELSDFLIVKGSRPNELSIPDFLRGENELISAINGFSRIDRLFGLKHYFDAFAKEKRAILIDRYGVDMFDSLLSCVAETVRGRGIAVIVVDSVAVRDGRERTKLLRLGADFIIDNGELFETVPQLVASYGINMRKEIRQLKHASLMVTALTFSFAAISGLFSAATKHLLENGIGVTEQIAAGKLVLFCIMIVAIYVAKRYFDNKAE